MPELRSCHLYAGHRLVGTQAPSRLLPGWICNPGFDVIVHDFDASAVVHWRASPQRIPNAVSLRLSVSLTTMALDHSRIRRFEASTCLAASEGLPPSQVQLDTAHQTRTCAIHASGSSSRAAATLMQPPGVPWSGLVSSKSLPCLLPADALLDGAFPPVGRLGLTSPPSSVLCAATTATRSLSERFACRSRPRVPCLLPTFVVSVAGSSPGGSPGPRQGLWSAGPPVPARVQGDRWLSHVPEFPL